jgi:protein O-mannosyl-transferase
MATMAKKSQKKSPRASRQQSAASGFWSRIQLQAALLFAFVLVLYGQTISYEYALDDKIVVSENKFVKQGLAGLPSIFTLSTFDGHTAAALGKNWLSGGRYRPLSLAMFTVEYALTGGKSWLLHAMNVLLYGVLVVVLFLLWHALFGANASPPHSSSSFNFRQALPFLACALFVAHPAHVEVVANIKSRDEILTLLLSLASLWAYIRYVRRKLAQDLAWAAVAIFFALLAKESAVTFLFVLPLSAWFFAGKLEASTLPASSDSSDSSEKATAAQSRTLLKRMMTGLLPIIAVTVAFFLVRASIVGFLDGRSSPSIFDNPFLRVGTSERLATAVAMLGRYAVYTLHPLALVHEYSHNAVTTHVWTDWQVLVSLAFHGLLLGVALWFFPRAAMANSGKDHLADSPTDRTASHFQPSQWTLLAYCIWFYAATISIVSNVVFSIGTLFGERFLFMPSVASSLAWAWLLCWLGGRLMLLAKGQSAAHSTANSSAQSSAQSSAKATANAHAWVSAAAPSVLALVLVGGMCGVYSYRVFARNPSWSYEMRLLGDDTAAMPNSLRNRRVFAGYVLRDIEREQNPKVREVMLRTVFDHLNACIGEDSTADDKAYFYMGQYYAMFRDSPDSADFFYRRSHELSPDDPSNRVYFTFNRGNRLMRRKLYDSAIGYYRSVMGLGVEEETLYYNQGVALTSKNEIDSAQASFEHVLKLNPNNPSAQQGVAYCQRIRAEQAAKRSAGQP